MTKRVAKIDIETESVFSKNEKLLSISPRSPRASLLSPFSVKKKEFNYDNENEKLPDLNCKSQNSSKVVFTNFELMKFPNGFIIFS